MLCHCEGCEWSRGDRERAAGDRDRAVSRTGEYRCGPQAARGGRMGTEVPLP